MDQIEHPTTAGSEAEVNDSLSLPPSVPPSLSLSLSPSLSLPLSYTDEVFNSLFLSRVASTGRNYRLQDIITVLKKQSIFSYMYIFISYSHIDDMEQHD